MVVHNAHGAQWVLRIGQLKEEEEKYLALTFVCAEDKYDIVSLTIKRGGLVHHNTQEPTDTHTYVHTYIHVPDQ